MDVDAGSVAVAVEKSRRDAANIEQYVGTIVLEHVSRTNNKIMMLETDLRRLNNCVVHCSSIANRQNPACEGTRIRLLDAYFCATCSRPFCEVCFTGNNKPYHCYKCFSTVCFQCVMDDISSVVWKECCHRVVCGQCKCDCNAAGRE